jgi:LmbE family N-acetylglucosaminyl deacetylase
MIRSSLRSVLLLPVLLTLLAGPAAAQVAQTEYEGAAALGLSLRSLGTTKRVLMIGAHPDDEQTQVLSALALGQGAEVGYLSLTRGEGGQNGIGAELQEGLGLVRTEELLAARRLDGAQQFFTRAIDYGFSKNADEAFSQWPREELLGDVVAVVRYFRPDVIISVFSGTPRDGHGQHQASGIMALEAFSAAADPTRFPEHLSEGLRPHAVTHLYQIGRGESEGGITLTTGNFDPLLGRSHFQIAMASRSRHRSQDMGRVETPGPQTTTLVRWESRVEESQSQSLFAGVDTTLSSLARSLARRDGIADAGRLIDVLGRYQAQTDDVRRTFNPFQPDQVVFFLVEANRQLEEAARLTSAIGSGEEDLRFRITEERSKLAEAIRRAGRVEIDAVADDETIVPGQTFTLDVTLWNGGNTPVEVTGMVPRVPSSWAVAPREGFSGTVAAGTLARQEFEISVPAEAELSGPYFLSAPRDGARYTWGADAGAVGIPFEVDQVSAFANITVQGAPSAAETIATFRGVDTRSGEFRRPVRVVPGISLVTEPRLAVLPLARKGEPLTISVRVTAEEPGGTSGILALSAPAGWRVEPSQMELAFESDGEERVVEFTAFAPADLSAGRTTMQALFTDSSGRRFEEGYTLVDYPHISPRPLYRTASLDVEAVDVEVPAGIRVGYVAQTGDNVPLALAQMGVDVSLLTEEQLAAAPLAPFDVIVIGSRAYEGRPDLVVHNQRLLDYVRAGGTMIVQYNQYQYSEGGMAPFDVSIARPHDRVTDEGAEVRLLDPEHPIFNNPNELSEADFEGWVQERGLYFLNSWDDAFTPLIEMQDPNEAPNRGGLLIANLGEGKYVYTGLALFRQFPAGVPGAYRLMANLLALGAD